VRILLNLAMTVRSFSNRGRLDTAWPCLLGEYAQRLGNWLVKIASQLTCGKMLMGCKGLSLRHRISSSSTPNSGTKALPGSRASSVARKRPESCSRCLPPQQGTPSIPLWWYRPWSLSDPGSRPSPALGSSRPDGSSSRPAPRPCSGQCNGGRCAGPRPATAPSLISRSESHESCLL